MAGVSSNAFHSPAFAQALSESGSEEAVSNAATGAPSRLLARSCAESRELMKG
jgi:hypothetical protein